MENNICKKCLQAKIHGKMYQIEPDKPMHIRVGETDRYVCGLRWLDTDIPKKEGQHES
jgi:hypothetical protein